MNIEDYLPKMRNIQENLLIFLDSDDDFEQIFEPFTDFLKDQNIQSQCLIEFLNLISKISENHNRRHDLIRKIESILTFLKDDIKHNFNNRRIFDIFQNNKRILLFLLEEQFLTIDDYIFSQLNKTYNSIEYFEPELTSFLSKSSKKIDPVFEENRKKGENDDYICQLIQEDLVEDFIVYKNKTNLSLYQNIETPSFLETNSFLLKNEKISLIEYAAFFGSIQIFRYLLQNNVELTPSLWLYAIHSNNPELIHLLEENRVEPEDKTYQDCFNESIKCYHNEIAKYIEDNLLTTNYGKDKSELICFYNFDFFTENIRDESLFASLCEFDYFLLVSVLINDSKVNNKLNIILKNNFIEFIIFNFNIIFNRIIK